MQWSYTTRLAVPLPGHGDSVGLRKDRGAVAGQPAGPRVPERCKLAVRKIHRAAQPNCWVGVKAHGKVAKAPRGQGGAAG